MSILHSQNFSQLSLFYENACEKAQIWIQPALLPIHMPNLIMYQNTCFAIQASMYSTLDQKWDGSIEHLVKPSIVAFVNQQNLEEESHW